MNYKKKIKSNLNFDNIIFLVTARGGSKRLPNKNMKILNNKPLIFWTFNTIKKTYKNAKIFISTDSKKIAKFSKKMNINVPFIRPQSISKDKSSSLSVINHFLKWMKKKEKKLPEFLVLLQPTSPFRSSKTIKECTKKLLKDNNYNAVVAMKYQKYNTSTLKFLDKDMYLKNLKLKKIQKILEPTGAYYGVKITTFLQQKTLTPKNTFPYIINELESIDIDNKFDWQIANSFSDKLTP